LKLKLSGGRRATRTGGWCSSVLHEAVTSRCGETVTGTGQTGAAQLGEVPGSDGLLRQLQDDGIGALKQVGGSGHPVHEAAALS
jgi:hypothetical protein